VLRNPGSSVLPDGIQVLSLVWSTISLVVRYIPLQLHLLEKPAEDQETFEGNG
jgi:hypothetical protein